MAGPVWAQWAFALLCAGIGAVGAVRLVGHSGADGRIESAHVLMAAGMTAMFLPVPTPIPPRWWAVAFAVHTAWLAVDVARSSRGTPAPGRAHTISHVVAGAVMAWMFASVPADALGGAGTSHAGHLGAIGWLAAAYFLGHAVWSGVRTCLRVPDAAGTGVSGAVVSGAVVSGAVVSGAVVARAAGPRQLVMGVGMAYMLMAML